MRLPPPSPVSLQPITWKVLSATKTPVLKPGSVYFALAPKDYEALARNMAEIARWTGEARWQIDYYRKDRRNASH